MHFHKLQTARNLKSKVKDLKSKLNMDFCQKKPKILVFSAFSALEYRIELRGQIKMTEKAESKRPNGLKWPKNTENGPKHRIFGHFRLRFV